MFNMLTVNCQKDSGGIIFKDFVMDKVHPTTGNMNVKSQSKSFTHNFEKLGT